MVRRKDVLQPSVYGTDFVFRHSTSEVTYIDENGKRNTYKVCDACGAKQKSNCGLTLSFTRRNVAGKHHIGLCYKCANKIVPLFEEALEDARGIIRGIRESSES